MNRNEAIEQGSKTYEGRPCKNCGTTLKYVTNWGCVSCSENRKENPEVRKRYEHSEKGKAARKKINQSDAHKERQAALNHSNKARMAEYYQANKERWRDSSLQKTYGITLEDYNSMLTEQQGCCKVCGTHEGDLNQALAVDHCHKQGHVRALLCSNCNTALGLLKEDINIMRKLIEYTETSC